MATLAGTSTTSATTNSTIYGPSNAIVCYSPNMITANGVWQGENPLDYSLPLFVLQLMMIAATTRVFIFFLKPFRQPRVVSEILGGIVLGPSVLGRNTKFANTVFPLRSVMVLETMANVGLVYFLFLVGVEMDLAVLRRTGTKAVLFAIAGMILPFIMGGLFSFLVQKPDPEMGQATFVLFLGVALSVTAFPVLARLLAELKLFNTEVGQVAMSSALVNDMCAWILLAFAIALAENKSASLATLWVVLSGSGFIAFSIFVVRPLVLWMVRNTPEGQSLSEFYVSLILTGVMICGFITDAMGTHSVFGAFVFGLVIPSGAIGVALIEKLEDFVSGLLLPLFFAISGLRTNVAAMAGPATWGFIMFFVALAGAGKIAGTLLVARYYKMPRNEGVALGLLMNTKGLVEMIVLNVGMDQRVLDDESFAVMVVTTTVMTAVITPLITSAYKPSKPLIPYKRRSIQRSKPDSEFRVLVCIHTPRNVPTIINLLEASHATKRSPIFIYVLHLVELTARASAMLIVHNMHKSGAPAVNRTQAQSDHIIHAFENYEQHAGSVSVQPLTAVSPYSTMHEDICNLAEDKRVAFIIIPFHKQQTVDGWMEASNPAFRTINQNILANAPCSVGILVDRGLSGSTGLSANHKMSHHVAVLFFGGPDDREGLYYAMRMSEHPGVSVSVMRFVSGEDSCPLKDSNFDQKKPNNNNDPEKLTVETLEDRERKLDEECLIQFKTKCSESDNGDGQGSLFYEEKMVSNGEETVAAIREVDEVHDLFIVGRGQGRISRLTAGLTDWSECLELGAIGDLLASSDFATNASILVVQQYVGGPNEDELGLTPDSCGNIHETFAGKHTPEIHRSSVELPKSKGTFNTRLGP